MREFLTFLTAVVILAIAQTLTTALGIALLIFALLGVVAFPRQTFGLIASLGILSLALQQPFTCVAALALVGVAIVVVDCLKRPSVPLPAPLLLSSRQKSTDR